MGDTVVHRKKTPETEIAPEGDKSTWRSEVLAATFKPSFPSPKYNITTSIWSVRPWTKRIYPWAHCARSRQRGRGAASAYHVRAHPDFKSKRCLWQLDEGLMVWRGKCRDDKNGNDRSVLRHDGTASSALRCGNGIPV